jgi:hypothetical protein
MLFDFVNSKQDAWNQYATERAMWVFCFNHSQSCSKLDFSVDFGNIGSKTWSPSALMPPMSVNSTPMMLPM